MAACKKCAQPIAWKKAWKDGRSVWVPHDPMRDADGSVIFELKKNGGGRSVKRSVPSDVPHRCPTADMVEAARAIDAEIRKPKAPRRDPVVPPRPMDSPKVQTPPGPWERIAPDMWGRGSERREVPRIPVQAEMAWERLERILRETQLHRVFAYGPPGTGKTTLPHRLADELGWA